MSTLSGAGHVGPSLTIRGTRYPVLLPRLRDPRLHLAAIIVTLQVLGQVAFEFRLSIAQILIAIGTCAAIEVALVFRRRRVLMWPASALLTGNGVSFILRVPGTQHGDWWSTNGWWLYAGTAAVAILSKYVLRVGGRHVFNPSNLGLVLCFLAFGPERADPLAFWWGPMSPALAAALALIVAGGFVILWRVRLVGVALSFWLVFAACMGILAATGHAMTARWHLGPVADVHFWVVLMLSPEILIFLFFMITDPKTVPDGRRARIAYGAGIALLASVLIAPQTTEFWSKVALLGALTLVCGVRYVLLLALPRGGAVTRLHDRGLPLRPTALGALGVTGAAVAVGVLVAAGLPARSTAGTAQAEALGIVVPAVTVGSSAGVAPIDTATARRIATDVVADLQVAGDALRARDRKRAATVADGSFLASLWGQMGAATATGIPVPAYRVERMRISLQAATGQEQPIVVAQLGGTAATTTWAGTPPSVVSKDGPVPFERTLELRLQGSRYLITGERGTSGGSSGPAAPTRGTGAFAALALTDVAARSGIRFRQDAFRFGMSNDPQAMMGGGVCWLDANGDGRMDLYAVNSYADADYPNWDAAGGLPRSALFLNTGGGRFRNVSASSGAGLRVKGMGCAAGDLNGDGRTDLVVTTATGVKLLWNDGNGHFTEGARTAGIRPYGWYSGIAIADVNGDGRPDLFVSGYTDMNWVLPDSMAGFPTNHHGVRSLLYLNTGDDRHGHAVFREVGQQAGIDPGGRDHGLGAVFTDVNGDGRPDLYVANDADPNRLYLNEPYPGGVRADPLHLGFRFVDRAKAAGVADPNAGMGIAIADFNGDGIPDLVVTNSHKQMAAAYAGTRTAVGGVPRFRDARPGFAQALDLGLARWGVSLADLDRDGNPDLVVADGAIPVMSVKKDAEPIQVLQNLTGRGQPGVFQNASAVLDTRGLPPVVGRGLATADVNDDGTLDFAVNSIGGPLVLLRTAGARGHWLQVALRGFHPGALVSVVLPDGKTITRQVFAGSSFLSSDDPRPYFGLGAATRVKAVVVRFPGGGVARLANVRADRVVTVAPPR